MSLGMIVTRLAWIAHKLVSSKRPTRYISEASWSAKTSVDWKRRSAMLIFHNNLMNKTLEWSLADEELSALLVLVDFAYRHSSWSVTMGLFDQGLWWRAAYEELRLQSTCGRFASYEPCIRSSTETIWNEIPAVHRKPKSALECLRRHG
jgi:hypothetical protein